MPQEENDEEEIVEFYDETVKKYETATQKISDCQNKISEVMQWDKIPLESKNASIEKIKLEVKRWEQEQQDSLRAIEFIKKDLPNVEAKSKAKQKAENEKSLVTKEPRNFKKPVGFWGGVFNKFTKTIDLFKESAPKSAEDLKKKMGEELINFERQSTKNGVNFSRCNIENVVKSYKDGKQVEFELFLDNINLEKVLNDIFPKAKKISEDLKTKEAEQLVKRLEENNNLKREGETIYFVNPESENPEYKEILLKTGDGIWSSEALNASTYLKPENLEIIHLVIFPDRLKKQQDKTWEILRVLGIKPINYHDIFFDESVPIEKVAETIKEEIEKI